MLHLLALTCRIWNLEWLEFLELVGVGLSGNATRVLGSEMGKGNNVNPSRFITNSERNSRYLQLCLNLTCVISSQTKVNLTKALCNANVGQGYNRISEWRVIIFQPSKNKHLDTVKPRIDCGFGEGNIVAHVALPKAEAYQCFYT